ncbi:MAG: hypothetical protein RI920_2219, partial [Pseudomonadota bacterium]
AQYSLADAVGRRYGGQSIDQLASARDRQQIALLKALKASAEGEENRT